MQRLWILCVTGKGVQAVESSGGRVVVPGPQVLLTDPRIELLAGVQQGSFCRCCVKPNRISVGVVIECLDDRCCEVCQETSGTMTIVQEDECFSLSGPAGGESGLCDDVTTNGVNDLFDQRSRIGIGDRFL